MSENNTDRRNATQRIEDLEKVVTGMYQAMSTHRNVIEELQNQSFPSLRGDMGLVKEALKLLNRRLEAVIQAAKPESGITMESTSAILLQLNVEDLKAQVAGYLSGGQLAPAETVAENSFLVCEEVASDGTVANPRVQFRLDSQDESTQAVLMGKKVGDTASFGENKLSARITEIYSLVAPKAPEAEAAEAAPAEAPATEAAPMAEVTPAATETAPAAELAAPESAASAEATPSTAASTQEPAAVQENYAPFQIGVDGAAGTNASTTPAASA